jgi:hypothetical protein
VLGATQRHQPTLDALARRLEVEPEALDIFISAARAEPSVYWMYDGDAVDGVAGAAGEVRETAAASVHGEQSGAHENVEARSPAEHAPRDTSKREPPTPSRTSRRAARSSPSPRGDAERDVRANQLSLLAELSRETEGD